MSFSEKVEGSVEVTQKVLCVYRLSKGRNLGLTEYSNLELSGNNKGACQLTKEVILFPDNLEQQQRLMVKGRNKNKECCIIRIMMLS